MLDRLLLQEPVQNLWTQISIQNKFEKIIIRKNHWVSTSVVFEIRFRFRKCIFEITFGGISITISILKIIFAAFRLRFRFSKTILAAFRFRFRKLFLLHFDFDFDFENWNLTTKTTLVRRHKTTLRSTMSQERLTSLVFMNMCYDVPIDAEEVVKIFIQKTSA